MGNVDGGDPELWESRSCGVTVTVTHSVLVSLPRFAYQLADLAFSLVSLGCHVLVLLLLFLLALAMGLRHFDRGRKNTSWASRVMYRFAMGGLRWYSAVV